jgi:phage repressor protein C with HTH and peptisase S24 domain
MHTFPSVATKLKLLIDSARSQKEVARLAVVSDGTLINWLRGHGVRESKLRQVARSLGVSLEWLRGGEGDDATQLAAFRAKAGSPDDPLPWHGLGRKTTFEAQPEVELPDGTKGRYVPLLSCAHAAAWEGGRSHSIDKYIAIFALHVDDPSAFAMKVLGNSMEPVLHEGDLVVCSPSHPARDGEAAVVRTRREQIFINFCRYRGRRVLVESANPDYKPIDLPLTEIAGAWPIVQTIIAGPRS